MITHHPAGPDELLARCGASLRRALVARYGVEVGTEAHHDAAAYACAHWAELSAMANPAGYLFRVGQTAAKRHRRLGRPAMLAPRPVSVSEPVDVDLQRALLDLRHDQRIAVVLVHGHGHSYAEVAELLGCSVAAVGNHIHRGLARLRTLLEPS